MAFPVRAGTRAPSRRPRSRRAAIAGASLLAALASGCVVEKPRGAPKQAAPSGDLPSGPVARPAGQTSSFRVRVEVLPLGSLPYDGVTLPLVAPSGRLAAVQSGEAPTWPTLMAEADAQPPAGTRVSVYDLTSRPPSPVGWPGGAPAGVMLGRGSDDAGFLVEAPHPDGARWIGRVAWLSGRLEWLVQDGNVNSHAVVTGSGDLLFSRRAPDATRAELVLRRTDGGESVLVDSAGSYGYPMTAGDPLQVFALVRSRGRLELEVIPLVHDPPDLGPLRFGASRFRRTLAASGDPGLAFQVAAPVHPSLPPSAGSPAADDRPRAPLLLFHPALKRMASFDPASGGFAGLAPGSVAAVHWPGPPEGFFCTTPDGLVFTRDPRAAEPDTPAKRPDARVLADPCVPRPTRDPLRPVILLGPNPRDPERIRFFAMSVPGG